MLRLCKALSRFVMRYVLSMRERKRLEALIAALSEVSIQATRSRRYEFASSAVVLNLALFFLIAERDIQAVKIDALTHPDAWRRKLCARIILLTIHELDLDKVAGNKLREALVDAGVSEETKNQATLAIRAVRKAQQKAQKEFAFLRNATIAHRDPDAVVQYRSIAEIDEMEVCRIAGDFYQASHLFLNIIPELLIRVGTMPGLMSQLQAQANRRK